ncbi:MAG: type II secretion system protein [Dehalococcoidales bacterium]|nr:type II secretion system protein [Dehalococcoidales bacterium]
MKLIQRHIHKQRGFTLIEILIVLVLSAIIGLAVVEAIFQTYSTFDRNIARTEANSQVGYATKYIHQDAQMSQIVYIYDTVGHDWVPADDRGESDPYNILNYAFLLERPFWDITESGYQYECYKYEIDQSTRELIRSHYYYDNIGSPGSPDIVFPVAKNIDISLFDGLGNPVINNYWKVASSSDYPNGMFFTAQITCTVGDRYPQTVTGKVDVIRMMAW